MRSCHNATYDQPLSPSVRPRYQDGHLKTSSHISLIVLCQVHIMSTGQKMCAILDT